MRRFPPRDLPPRPPRDLPPRPPRQGRGRPDLPRPEGPFDRILRPRLQRDPAPFIIGGTLLFIGIVIIMVFAFSGLLGDGNGGEERTFEQAGIKGKINPSMPAPPPGLVVLSRFYEFEVPEDRQDLAATIGIPLKDSLEDPDNAAFYTFTNGRWHRIADLTLSNDGSLAQADFSPIPENLAVLRSVAQVFLVAGSLPAGNSIHPEGSSPLNIVNPRDYRPAADGSVQGQATQLELGPDQQLLPTIVANGPDSAAIVDDILSDDRLRQAHIEAILALVKGGDFTGIDLEYTEVDPALKGAFTDFVNALARALHDRGRKLSITLPPATSTGPAGGAAAYDWEPLGQAADMIKVLPITDPVAYWEVMPDAIEFAADKVDRQKLFLVVSPFSASKLADGGGVEVIGYQQAMLLAVEAKVRQPSNPDDIKPGTRVELVAENIAEGGGSSGLRWSDDAAAIAFAFAGDEGRRVFVENALSVGFKLELVQAYGLGGVALADASAESDVANVWPAVRGLIESSTAPLVRPNGDLLLPRWEAPDGGTLEVASGAVASWVAPQQPGTYTIDLIVSDGFRRFGRHIAVTVTEPPAPTPEPVVTFPPEEPTPTATPGPEGTATPSPGPEEEATPTPEPAP